MCRAVRMYGTWLWGIWADLTTDHAQPARPDARFGAVSDNRGGGVERVRGSGCERRCSEIHNDRFRTEANFLPAGLRSRLTGLVAVDPTPDTTPG